AANCLWVLGFQTSGPRVLAHGLLGCAFYGAFVAKLLTLHSRRLPNWALPVVAGLLLTAVVGVSLTSAVWYLGTGGAPHGAKHRVRITTRPQWTPQPILSAVSPTRPKRRCSRNSDKPGHVGRRATCSSRKDVPDEDTPNRRCRYRGSRCSYGCHHDA